MSKGLILLVDDEPMVIRTTREVLEYEDYTVEVAYSGEEAWALAQGKQYDLLLTDWQMGTMTGLQLAEQVSKRWPDTRIIVVTAYEERFAEDMDKRHFRASFLRKGADIDDLLNKVEGMLQGRRLRFVLGQLVPMVEDRQHEFKEVKGQGPVNTIKNTADEYAVAFLNSEGGSIYWGIKDNGEVGGVQLAVGQRDEIRRVVNEKLAQIQPTVAVSSFRVECHPVYTEQGAEIAETCVVEVVVPPGSPKVLYFTGSNEAFVKVDGARRKLNGPQIQAEIQKRLEL